MALRECAKTAVITGSASGIGRALSLALAERGWKVGIVDVDIEGAEETLQMVIRAGGEGDVFRCNVRKLQEVVAAADHFYQAWGQVGMLINNAGIGGGGYVGDIAIEQWETVVETDFWGVVYGCHVFIPRMKAQGAGHIVNVSSIAGLLPVMGFAPYNTSKAAVVSLSETLRVELAPFNIGVTVVCPSVVRTGILDNTMKVMDLGDSEEERWGLEMLQAAFRATPMTMDDFSRVVMRGIEKNRLYVLPRFSARLVWFGVRLAPSLNYRMWAFLNRHGLAMKAITSAARRGWV